MTKHSFLRSFAAAAAALVLAAGFASAANAAPPPPPPGAFGGPAQFDRPEGGRHFAPPPALHHRPAVRPAPAPHFRPAPPPPPAPAPHHRHSASIDWLPGLAAGIVIGSLIP